MRAAVLGLALAAGLLALSCEVEPPPQATGDSPGMRGRPVADRAAHPVQGSGDNVVLIIIDTLRADKLGSYGFPLETSPEIDRLAERGVRFERVISQCSWTRPSTGSLLTARYPRSLGLYRGRDEVLDERFETLAEVLRANGYDTFGVTANPQIAGRLGFGQGFTRYLDHPRAVARVMGRSGARRSDAHNRDGKDTRSVRRPMRPPPKWNRYEQLPSAQVFAAALALADHRRAGPSFVQLNLMEAHRQGPRVRQEYAALFTGQRERRYLRAVRQLSADVSRFLDELLARPGWESTLVVLASDHGEGLTDHPGIKDGSRHGFLLYESHVWVPLIMLHSKGAFGPSTVARPVRNMDIMPTVLDFLGLPPPADVDGRSLAPLLTDPAAAVDLPASFVVETYRPDAAKIGVYGNDWKYFENRDEWPLLNRRELQGMHRREIGAFTDEIDRVWSAADDLDAYLERWEQEHPKAMPVYRKNALPRQLAERLEGLGYLSTASETDNDGATPGPP